MVQIVGGKHMLKLMLCWRWRVWC